jgi:hypothetical protein
MKEIFIYIYIPINLFILFIYLCLRFMTCVILRDLAALCGNEHVTKPQRANTQGRIFSLLVRPMCYATLTVTYIGIYSTEELLGA